MGQIALPESFTRHTPENHLSRSHSGRPGPPPGTNGTRTELPPNSRGVGPRSSAHDDRPPLRPSADKRRQANCPFGGRTVPAGIECVSAAVMRSVKPKDGSVRLIGVRVSGVAVVLVCFAAGCASTGPITGSARPASPPVASSAVAVSAPVAVAAVSTPARSQPVTVAANKAAADAEASRLLMLAQVPPGATEIAVPPAGLSGPIMGTPGTTSLIDHARYWRVAMSFADALAWLKAHPPQTVASGGSMSGTGPDGQSGGYSYQVPDSPGWTQAQLEIGVASAAAGVSDIRADGIALWFDPVPLQDTASGPRMRVSVAGGCPATDAGAVGVRNSAPDLATMLLPAASPTGGLICEYAGLNGIRFGLIKSTKLDADAAAQLASAVSSSPVSHLDNEEVHCPMDDASAAVLVFSYPGRADVDVWYARNGCRSVSNGYIAASTGDILNELANPAASGPPFPAPAATS
jgi:hypothetical protein